MSRSQAFAHRPFERLPDPRILWPTATVIVHFHHEVGGDPCCCTVYRQELELRPGSGYSQAIDVLLNQDSDGQPIPVERRPLGEECKDGHVS